MTRHLAVVHTLTVKHQDPREKPIPTPWQDPIDPWLAHLAATGSTRQSIKTRRDHGRRIARALGGSPASATGAQLTKTRPGLPKAPGHQPERTDPSCSTPWKGHAKNPSQYAPEECYDANERGGLNWYGLPNVLPEYYEGEHFAAVVPPSGGDPPVCSCGWTRWGDDRLGWVELSDHLCDMGIGAGQ